MRAAVSAARAEEGGEGEGGEGGEADPPMARAALQAGEEVREEAYPAFASAQADQFEASKAHKSSLARGIALSSRASRPTAHGPGMVWTR